MFTVIGNEIHYDHQIIGYIKEDLIPSLHQEVIELLETITTEEYLDG